MVVAVRRFTEQQRVGFSLVPTGASIFGAGRDLSLPERSLKVAHDEGRLGRQHPVLVVEVDEVGNEIHLPMVQGGREEEEAGSTDKQTNKQTNKQTTSSHDANVRKSSNKGE